MSTKEFMRTALFVFTFFWLLGILGTGLAVYVGWNMIVVDWMGVDVNTLSYFQSCMVGIFLSLMVAVVPRKSSV